MTIFIFFKEKIEIAAINLFDDNFYFFKEKIEIAAINLFDDNFYLMTIFIFLKKK